MIIKMVEYQNLLRDIIKNGQIEKNERTGTGTKKVFGRMISFDLSKGFPILTTKKVYLRAIIHELLWFIRGDTNIRYLVKRNVRIWNEWSFQKYLKAKGWDKKYPTYTEKWNEQMKIYIERIKTDKKFADKWGNLGPVYGTQWRNFNGFDQLKNVIEKIKTNPGDRRLIVNSWNAPLIKDMALPPCHFVYQFGVLDKKLSCLMSQRSVDTFLGLPFNIASYALLTMMVAQVTGNKPGTLTISMADTHIYLNHMEQVKEILGRKPYPLPTMKINPKVKSIFKFKYEDFNLINYKSHPPIRAQVSV